MAWGVGAATASATSVAWWSHLSDYQVHSVVQFGEGCDNIAYEVNGELIVRFSVDRMADLVGTDDRPLAEWRREAAETYATVAGEVPVVHRRPVEAFLDVPPPDDGYTLTFSHNDLGIEHVLVDPVAWTVTGIIDWSDVAIVDPAYDFGLLHRDLGPAAVDVAIRSYRTDVNDVVTLGERAVFYARCSVFEDLACGIETGRDKYVDKSLAAMRWLFPA